MTDLSSVIQRVLPQTVAVIAPSAEVLQHLKNNPQMAIEPPICGSGYFYSDKGHIITNHHVIADADPNHIEVMLFDGSRIPAKLIGSSPSADVAVLKVTPFKGMQVTTFADSDTANFGNPCFAIGAPKALEFTVSQGIVSNPKRFDRRWRQRFGNVSILPIMQTDASVNPGNSGGALFNADGEVIGMNTFITTPVVMANINGVQGPIGAALGSVGLNFALTGNAVKETADKIIKKGASLASMDPGFTLQAPTSLDRSSMRDPVARVRAVVEGSAADKAGLKAGDVLQSVNGVETPHTMAAQYRLFCAAGGTATLKVLREVDGKKKAATVELSFEIPETETFIGWDNPGGNSGGLSLDRLHAQVSFTDSDDDEGIRD